MKFYSTNNKNEIVNFEKALLKGLASDFGLYMVNRKDIPKITQEKIEAMNKMNYSQIAFEVLYPFLKEEISDIDLKNILDDAYNDEEIPTIIESLTKNVYIMWLSHGPTYAFKDYAARFLGRILNYFLNKRKIKKTIVVATSGDTGGAVANALLNLPNISCVIFFPKESISEEQRRQMTTLKNNIYAFSVNGDFDVCQDLAKTILNDKDFAKKVFDDPDHISSANSISLGRLLPQMIYPFFAYSRIANKNEEIIASIPSGNFGDMMGTVLAKEMGLKIKKIICGVNENKEFPEFLKNNKYEVKASIYSPSSAMIVSHASNLARLVDFYQGHIYDERDSNNQIINPGIIDKMPNMKAMKDDIFSVSINNKKHFETIERIYKKYNIIIEPHGAVGIASLEKYLFQKDQNLDNTDSKAVIYETADPAKFKNDVKKAIGFFPEIPEGIKKQENLEERIYEIKNISEKSKNGLKLTQNQIEEAKEKIKKIFSV